MRRSRLAPLVCCVLLAGCGTIYTFPLPMGGVRGHAEMLGIGQSGNYLRGIGTTLWFVCLPLTLPDLALSFAADLVLLPILGPPELVKAIRESRRETLAEDMAEARAAEIEARRPPPPTPQQVAEAKRRHAVAYAEALRAQEERAALDLLLKDARRAAAGDPDEEQRVSAVVDRLYGSPQVVSRVEDTFVWLREGAPVGAQEARVLGSLMDAAERRGPHASEWIMAAHLAERRGDAAGAIELCNAALALDPVQGPAWTVRGWARLQQGDLERAELDLGLGDKLSFSPLNHAWATIGLGRVDEARGRRAQARLRYERVLGQPAVVASLQLEGVDHVSDLRRRVERLAGE